MSDPFERWRADLAAWAIPEPILRAVDESPWTLPRQCFRRRARKQLEAPGGVSFDRAVEALAPPGEVLDVGAGAGSASLPLVPWASAVTAVDSDGGMLDSFAELARELVPAQTVLGRWPDIADEVRPADVVVCHHVLYNVPDLAEFVTALTAHARRRVVVELTPRHPMSALNPLWQRFHGLERPQRPTVEDTVAALRALGLQPHTELWSRPVEPEFGTFAEMVETTARRLCLPPGRYAEVDRALREQGVDPETHLYLGASNRELATIWWAGR